MSIHAYMYKENAQSKNPLCAASGATKNIYPRCKFGNLTSTPMSSSRLYAENPVFKIIHERESLSSRPTHVQREYSAELSMSRILCH